MLSPSSSFFAIPGRFLCSITGQIMAEPVITADGHTYEREAIEEWLRENDTSPKTGQVLKHKDLTPNWDKISDLGDFLGEYPSLKESSELYLPKTWVRALVCDLKSNASSAVMKWFAKDLRLLIYPLEVDYTAFHLAAEFGSPELVEALWRQLEAHGGLEMVPLSPKEFEGGHLNVLLERALEQQDWLKAVQWLRLGADLEQPDLSGNSLLARCVCRDQMAAVKWLFMQGASLSSCNHEGNSPLHLSVIHHQATIAAFLLEMKADPRLKNNEDQSSLHLAILTQSQSMMIPFVGAEQAALLPYHIALIQEEEPLTLMKTLLDRGNDRANTLANSLDAQGRTPLWIASERGDVAIARWLINNVDVSLEQACGFEQQTALHIAAKRGHLGMVGLLIESGASIESLDLKGNTALHYAAEAGSEVVINCLLEAGAYYKVKNHENQTPMELARQHYHIEIANFIQKKGYGLKYTKKLEAEKLMKEQSERILKLEELCEEQSTRISELTETLWEQSTRHEMEQLAFQHQITSLEQALKERLTMLNEALTELQPKASAPLVFSSPPVFNSQNPFITSSVPAVTTKSRTVVTRKSQKVCPIS